MITGEERRRDYEGDEPLLPLLSFKSEIFPFKVETLQSPTRKSCAHDGKEREIYMKIYRPQIKYFLQV